MIGQFRGLRKTVFDDTVASYLPFVIKASRIFVTVQLHHILFISLFSKAGKVQCVPLKERQKVRQPRRAQNLKKTKTEPKPKRKSYERQRFRARGSGNVSLMYPFLGNGTNEQSESRNEQFFHKFNDELFIIF